MDMDDKQTLDQAVALARTGRVKSLRIAAWALDGMPVGGWGDTSQARRTMVGELPPRRARAYSADEWVERMYTIDAADRYRSVLADEG